MPVNQRSDAPELPGPITAGDFPAITNRLIEKSEFSAACEKCFTGTGIALAKTQISLPIAMATSLHP